MLERENTEDTTIDLDTVIYSAIDQKQNPLHLYPDPAHDPVDVPKSRIAFGQMLKHEEELTDWLNDPTKYQMGIVYGHLFEIVATHTLNNVFKGSDIEARLSPAEYDFVSSKKNPSFDILLCERYRIGYVPLVLIDTKLSKNGPNTVHHRLRSPLIHLSGRTDFNMEIPQIDILDIGLDRSGKKLRDLSKEKSRVLRDRLLFRLNCAMSYYKDPIIRGKIGRVVEDLNGD
jgi:hypothetical protein